jgi:hypothetical protein
LQGDVIRLAGASWGFELFVLFCFSNVQRPYQLYQNLSLHCNPMWQHIKPRNHEIEKRRQTKRIMSFYTKSLLSLCKYKSSESFSISRTIFFHLKLMPTQLQIISQKSFWLKRLPFFAAVPMHNDKLLSRSSTICLTQINSSFFFVAFW